MHAPLPHLPEGRPAAAATALTDHLEAHPEDAVAWDLLAEALLALDQPEGAAEAARCAVVRGSREAVPLLALALARVGRVDESRVRLRAVLEAGTATARGWERVARAFEALGETERGLQNRRRAHRRDPSDAGIALRLAEKLERADQPDEARRLAEHVEAQSPNHPGAGQLLVRLDHHAGEVVAAADRARRLLRAGVSPGVARGLWSELGRLEAKLGDPDAAMDAATRAHALAVAAWRSAGGSMDAWPEALARVLASPPPSPPAPRPGGWSVAFVVGFPRSGTTLLQQVLEAHPDLVTLDELPLVEGAVRDVLPGRDLAAAVEAAGEPEVAAALRDAFWRRVRRVVEPGHRTVIDKQPLNLARVDLLARMFPGAPIAAMVRDPRDTVISAFLQDFELNAATVQCADLDRCARLYAQVAALGARARGRIPGFVELRYEALVADRDATLAPLLEGLGLASHPDLRRHHELARTASIGTPSYRDVRQPLFDRSIGRWRAFEHHLRPVLRHLAPALRDLAYGSDPG